MGSLEVSDAAAQERQKVGRGGGTGVGEWGK